MHVHFHEDLFTAKQCESRPLDDLNSVQRTVFIVPGGRVVSKSDAGEDFNRQLLSAVEDEHALLYSRRQRYDN